MGILRGIFWLVKRLLFVVLLAVAAAAGSAATVASTLVFDMASDLYDRFAAPMLPTVTTVRARQAADTARLNTAHEQALARARGPVRYRGADATVKDAVKDTADRISRRVATATARNVATLPGEALPYVGAAVAVAATAWEVQDACALMQEMAELATAFEVGTPPERDSVCGQPVPTRAEIWAAVVESPAEVRADAEGLVGEIPALSRDTWTNLSAFIGSLLPR
jgi:hypothetical protein